MVKYYISTKRLYYIIQLSEVHVKELMVKYYISTKRLYYIIQLSEVHVKDVNNKSSIEYIFNSPVHQPVFYSPTK